MPHCAPGSAGVFHLLAAMGQVGSPHHLAGGLVDHREAGRPTPWIQFHPQRRYHSICWRQAQDYREGVATEYCRLLLGQQPLRAPVGRDSAGCALDS